MILLAGGILFAGFVGCADNGTTVKVETTPSAAKVFIDGKFVGLSPCECFIRDAKPDDLWEQHTVEVKAKGFEAQSRRLRYRTGAAWLPDKIEFVMNPTLLIDEPETPKDKSAPVVKPAPAPTPKPVAVKTPEKTPAVKPAVAARINEFRSTTPWAKAAPLNDDNIPPASPKKEPVKEPVKESTPRNDLQARHAEMEKIVVSAKGSSVVTAPTPGDFTPGNPESAERITAATPSRTGPAVEEKYERTPGLVPITRPRLAPLPKQVAMADKSSRPQFVGSVPWKSVSAANHSRDIELVSSPIKRHVTEKPASEKKRSSAPWIEAGGLGIEEAPAPEDPRQENEPQDERMFSCDLRIARVSDGVVLRQASGVDTYENLDNLAQDLVSELAAYVPDNASVAIFCFHNRRGTESGRFVADKMLEAAVSAVQKSPGLKYIKTVNIRDALGNENSLEQSKQLTKPRFYPLLKNAEYVIIGGVALFDNFAETSTRPVSRETKKHKD